MSAPIDYSDLQGILRYGYGRLPHACFLLVKVKDRGAAQAWLRTAPVSNAVERTPRPATALQIAFTPSGLAALGVPRQILEKFSPEFVSGMVGEPSRSRRLGDLGANAPERWQWGAGGENIIDMLLMLYAEAGQLDGWMRQIADPSWQAAFDVVKTLRSEAPIDVEPFGFKDGLSQPELDWDDSKTLPEDKLAYENRTALGEFLLGYRNEYGKYTDRPLLPSGEDQTAGLLPAEEQPDKRDLACNGSYLVLRQLEQDVAGFWDFVARQSYGDSAAATQLAEAMVGRRKNGEPLIPSGTDDASLNRFTYETDPAGVRCPLGAHIRRANPRNSDFPYGTTGLRQKLLRMAGFHRASFRDDLVSSTRFHRLLRRGRGYGSADAKPQGIYFIALNANISRQFEFVQNAWVNSSKFDGLSDESDPLLGNRHAMPGCPVTDLFSLPHADGLTRRVAGLPQFVTVRGGSYFFLPSMRALWYLATLG